MLSASLNKTFPSFLPSSGVGWTELSWHPHVAEAEARVQQDFDWIKIVLPCDCTQLKSYQVDMGYYDIEVLFTVRERDVAPW